MYCRNCGKRVDGDRELCPECEVATKTETPEEIVEVVEEVKEDSVVETVKEEAVVSEVINVNETNNNPIKEETVNNNNNRNNTNNVNNKNVNNNGKSKLAAGLFGIFLGSFGVHNFYLGFTGKAVAQLLITVLSCGFLSPVSAIWGLIEGILLLSGDMKEDANGIPLKD